MAIRLLHVGVGNRGQHWLDIVKDYPDAVSVGCVDPTQSALERVSEKYPYLDKGMNLDDALMKISADAAIIASPPQEHVDNSIKCLKAGLSVMVEKPFALDLRGAIEIVKLGEQLGLPMIAAQNYRFNRVERTLRRVIQEDLLGRIMSVHWSSRRLRVGKGTFLESTDYAQMIDDGVHHFDSLRSILGCNPVSLVTRTVNPSWSDYQHGAITQSLIKMDKNVHVLYSGSLVSDRYRMSIHVEGENGEIWTNRKWIFLRKRGQRFFRPMKKVAVPMGDEAPYPREGSTSLLNSLRDALLKNREPETSARDNLWTLAMIEAGISSDRQMRDVGIEEVLVKARCGN